MYFSFYLATSHKGTGLILPLRERQYSEALPPLTRMAPPQARSTRRLSTASNSNDAQSQTAQLIIGSINSLKNQMIETNRLLNEKLDGIRADLDTLRAFVKKATPLIDANLATLAK